MTSLSYIDINPTIPTKRSVIWLHGLGADGSDFVPIVSELNLPTTSGVRFIFPNAPVMAVTINNGYHMPAWFDIYSFDRSANYDTAGMNASIAAITQLIRREEASGIQAQNIFLAGFSQGGAIALMTALRFPKLLGGVLALSSYLPLADELLQNESAENKKMPVFVAHGTQDEILPYSLGKATYVALSAAGHPTTWKSYDMPHSVCAKEVSDIRDWLMTQFNRG